MNYNHLIKNTLENIGSSFIFGVSTKLVYKSFVDFPDLFTLQECLNSGYKMGLYTLVNSINIFLLNKLGLKNLFLLLTSSFITNFYFNIKDGVQYAYKCGVNGVISSFVRNLLKI